MTILNDNFKELFPNNKPIIGMIHCAGTNPVNDALKEVEIFKEYGVDGIIVENYHGDIKDVEEVLFQIDTDEIVTGVNILPNEYEEAFRIADKYDADFIQLDYIAGHYKYRSQSINHRKYEPIKRKYKDIVVLGGVWPKYYQPVQGSDLSIDLLNGLHRAEAIVVTGEATGKQTPIEKIQEFRILMGDHPLIIGAGLNPENAKHQLEFADGGIVGSTFKPYGRTIELIDKSLVQEFMDSIKDLR